MATSIKIGQAANLLFGYRPAWDPSGSEPNPFFAPPTDSVQTSTPKFVPSADTAWAGTPTITLHETAQSLISAVYRYRVASMATDRAGVHIPAGPLALNDADSKQAIVTAGDFLGIDLSDGRAYMLVTMARVTGTAQHDFVSKPSAVHRTQYLTAAAQKVVAKLPPAKEPKKGSVLYDSKITKTEAEHYLNAMYALGTHFVSEITAGDMLVQVFAYDAKQFTIIEKAFANDATTQPDGTKAVVGFTANSWAYNTSKLDGQFGFVSSYGNLVALSRDPALASAISAGDWASQYVPTGQASIFAAAKDPRLTKPLQKEASIALTLMPLADLMPDLLVGGPWNRLVQGGLLQKFGDGITVDLGRQLDLDWKDIFPESVESWASNIVTPIVDIYQERVDLAKVALHGGPIVSANFEMQSFTSFSQVLQATTQPGDAPIDLPSDDITLIAQIIDMTEAVQTPVLKMSANALQKVQVFCEDMYGALIFEDDTTGAARRKVALDGFMFETLSVDSRNHRYKVGLSGVLSDTPGKALVSRLKQSIEFSIVAGESLLHSRGPNSDTVRELEKAYLLWLAGIIPADTDDIDLAQNRVRALYLAHNVSTFGSDLVFVPQVTYEGYTKYVGDMLNQAQTLNTQIGNYQIQITDTVNSYKVMDSIANLNDNVKQIGGVLTQYFGVLTNGRKAMDGYYDQILAQLDKELQSTIVEIKSLQTKLKDQQRVIDHLGEPPGIIQQFQLDYQQYETDMVAQAVMSGVSALFDIAVSFAGIPEAAEGGVLKALKAIKDVVEKLQALMKVLASLSAIQGVIGKIDKINTLAQDISAFGEKGQLEMPSQVDLQMMSEHVQAALVNTPDTGSLKQDRANMVAAVNNLVIIGTALLEAQIRASQLLVQISNNNRKKTINGQQEAQLAGLKNALHLNDSTRAPDINSINLLGVTGQLQYQLKQILTVLAETLELQDGALQYEYFGEPTPITSFSLGNLQAVITRQDSSIINALGQLNPQPQKVAKAITVSMPNVRVSRVSGGSVLQFPIHLCNSEFYNYDMVRIDRVIPRIKGIKSTKSGNYEVHLACQAKPFQDRDYHRQARTFATSRRLFGPYVYDVSTGKAGFGDKTGTFTDKVTHLTPFSLWQISLPDNVKNNQDIEFDSVLVDVEIDFYVTAHYDDPATWQTALYRSAGAVTDGNAPSLANLEAQMYQNQAVLQKWDAVFNVLEGPVNAFLYQQFQQYIAKLDPGNSDNLMEVSAYYCEGVNHLEQTYFTTVTKMTFKLSNPLLEFVAGSDSVTVRQNILSGSITSGTMVVAKDNFVPGDCKLIDGTVNFVAKSDANLLTLSVDGVFENNMQVKLKSTGTLPPPLKADTDYWIIGWASAAGKTTLQLSDTAGGDAIDLTSNGSGEHTIYPDIEWNSPYTVVIKNNPYVLGSVALAKVDGIVTPPSGQGPAQETHTVVLDFPQGAFTLNKFAVDPPNWDPSHHGTTISAALADFYASNDIRYEIQTINYSDLSKDTALQPSKFVLNAMKTNAGNSILQTLIATTGQVQHAHTITLNEPVPYDPVNPVPGSSDYMCSLMIGTKLMFDHIFVNSFNRGGTNLHIKAIDPGKDFEAWSAKIDQGTVTGTADFKNPYNVRNTDTNFRINSSNNDITWSLVGLTFKRSQSEGVDLAYTNGSATTSPPTGGAKVKFEYQQWIQGSMYSPGGWSGWTETSAMAYITMAGSYPLRVTGAGREQQVEFTDILQQPNFTKASDLKPSGVTPCDDNDIKIALLNSLGESVPGTLKSYLEKITFKPISVFALETLLFPAEQLITMQQARVPGDLLVVGSYLAQVRKKNASYDVTISASSGAKGEFGGKSFENGKGTGSVTQAVPQSQFKFTYGPIDPTIGNPVEYTIDIDAGTVSPPLTVVVDQPDPDNKPSKVILLPPGYPTADDT